MKLYIKSNDGVKINLWLPTYLLKSKLVRNIIKKYCKTNIELLLDKIPKMYSLLKHYVKENGHFNLIDIVSSDETTVIIKV